ncbi:unnamed protein product [Trifolium pratense]|uniref:Uncharacterized protein n=1 Tax=Trifolium pratense TaxID=57577 RepID=A0ACB0JL83_TRIPR|nr:unnamed protein product [Trifolium pratense]
MGDSIKLLVEKLIEGNAKMLLLSKQMYQQVKKKESESLQNLTNSEQSSEPSNRKLQSHKESMVGLDAAIEKKEAENRAANGKVNQVVAIDSPQSPELPNAKIERKESLQILFCPPIWKPPDAESRVVTSPTPPKPSESFESHSATTQGDFIGSFHSSLKQKKQPPPKPPDVEVEPSGFDQPTKVHSRRESPVKPPDRSVALDKGGYVGADVERRMIRTKLLRPQPSLEPPDADQLAASLHEPSYLNGGGYEKLCVIAMDGEKDLEKARVKWVIYALDIPLNLMIHMHKSVPLIFHSNRGGHVSSSGQHTSSLLSYMSPNRHHLPSDLHHVNTFEVARWAGIGVLGLNQFNSSNWDFALVHFKRKGETGLSDIITGNSVFRRFVQQREFTYNLKWLIWMNGNYGFQGCKHFDYYDLLELKDVNYKNLIAENETVVIRINGVSDDSHVPLFGVLCKFKDVQVENKWMGKYYRVVVTLMHKHGVCDDMLKIIQCLGDIGAPEYILKIVKKYFEMGIKSLEKNITPIMRLTLHKANFPPMFVIDEMLTPLNLEECDYKWETHECCWKGFPSLYSLLNFVYDRGKFWRILLGASNHNLDTITRSLQICKQWLLVELIRQDPRELNFPMAATICDYCLNGLLIFHGLFNFVFDRGKVRWMQISTLRTRLFLRRWELIETWIKRWTLKLSPNQRKERELGMMRWTSDDVHESEYYKGGVSEGIIFIGELVILWGHFVT